MGLLNDAAVKQHYMQIWGEHSPHDQVLQRGASGGGGEGCVAGVWSRSRFLRYDGVEVEISNFNYIICKLFKN